MQLKDILFIPLYIHQGKQMKRTIMRLPEATGDRHGSVKLSDVASKAVESNAAESKAIDQTLNLMIIGDSAAAGVGTETQEQALAGQLIANLQSSTVLQAKFSQINWVLHATSGHTSFDSLRRLYLLKPPATPVDIMIVNVGVNDTTKGVSPKRWRMQIEEIIEQMMDQHQTIKNPNLEEILETDRNTRKKVYGIVKYQD